MMKEKEMKRVPKLRFPEFTDDWEQRKLSDMVDVLDGDRGKNYPTSDDFDISGHTLFLNASNVTNDGFLFQDNQFITEVKSNSMGNGKLEEDDTLKTEYGGHWMAKSESDIFTPRTGQVIQAENGTQYFVCGNNRIKISEHFAAGGKPLGDLIVDVVRHTAEKAAST